MWSLRVRGKLEYSNTGRYVAVNMYPWKLHPFAQGWFKAIGVLVSPEHSLLSFWWQQSLTVAIPVHTLGMSRRHGLNRTDHPMYSIYNIQLFDLLTLNKTTINWINDQFDDVLNFNKSTFTQLLYFIFESLTMPDPNPDPEPYAYSLRLSFTAPRALKPEPLPRPG